MWATERAYIGSKSTPVLVGQFTDERNWRERRNFYKERIAGGSLLGLGALSDIYGSYDTVGRCRNPNRDTGNKLLTGAADETRV